MILPQVQITPECNLDCRYCFQEHTSPYIMNYETLNNIISKCSEYVRDEGIFPEKIEFTWHGGEPLIAGIEFLQKIIEIQLKNKDIRFINKLQTNGTLMTEPIAEFLNDFNFQVCFSIDGPEVTHNRYRVMRDNCCGSFDSVIKGIENYRRFGNHPLVSVSAVVTRYTVERGAREFYDFFRELGASVQLDPYDITCNVSAESETIQRASEFMPSAEEYGNFLIDLFNIWFYDKPGNIQFRDLKNEVKLFLCPDDRMASIIDKKRCSEHRTIFDPYGRVFSCDMYINNDSTSLGNINTDPLQEIIERKQILWEKIKRVFRAGEHTFDCFDCIYGDRCNGGCLTCLRYNAAVSFGFNIDNMPDNPNENPISKALPCNGDSFYCESYKMCRDHIEKVVQKEMLGKK